MEKLTNFFDCTAEAVQKTGGGSETRGVNHAIITQLSRNNHPITHRAMRYVAVLLAVFMVGIGNVWGDTYTVNSSITSTDALFSVSETMTNYTYSGYWDADAKLITFETGASITVTNVTGATITAITAEGVADNNSNKTVCFTASDGTTTAAGSSGSWNNRKSSSMTTGKAFNSTNVNKFKCDAGQTYTFTNNSSSSYKAGARIVITYTSTLPTSLTNGATTSSTQAVSWTAPSTAPANGYLVAYSTSSTAPGNSVTSTSGDYIVAAIAAGTTSASLSELSASTTYYWWVRSKNARGNSSWVAGSSFTTEAGGGCTDVSISTQPTSPVAATVGSACSISGLVASGTNPTYQWYTCNSDGSSAVEISAAGAMSFTGYTTATLGLTPTAEGATYYKCVVSGDCGDPVTSNVVTVNASPTYTVTYNSTGSDSGTAPSDATNYASGAAVTILGNTGSLAKSGNVFAGWNTASTLDGTNYAPGTKFNISANTNLYPVWAEGSEETITYTLGVKNATSGSVTPSTHLTNLVNETNVGIAEVTDQSKTDRSGKYATSSTEGYGVSFTFDIADGYTFHPTSIAIQLATVSTTDFTFYVTLEDANGTKLTSNALNTFTGDGVLTDVTFPAYDKTLAAGTVTMLVSATRAGGNGTYRIGKTITIKGAVAEAAPAACEAPSTVTIAPTDIAGNYGWRYTKGETIDFTCTYTGGTGTPSYQWQKWIGSAWTNINKATNASAGTARLQIENCTSGDGGSYRCVVSMGSDCDLASTGYFVRVFTLNGNYNDAAWTENAITWTGESTGTVTLHLNESSKYQFKVTDNDGKWFGYSENNYIIYPVNWNCGTENHNCRLFTGPEGDYVITINIANAGAATPIVNMQLAYPSVTHPVEGYVYFAKGDYTWTNIAAHWWKWENETATDFVAWASNPWLTQSVEICGTTYYYMPKLEGYNRVIFHNAEGDGQTSDITVDASSSGKYILGNSTEWTAFAKYTISFAGNGNTSGEMSAIENLCPGVDQALTANAFAKTGYNFTGWVADVDVTVGESTIIAGNLIEDAVTLKNITGNIALTAQWEKDCPTSGLLFSADVKVNSNQSFAASSTTKISAAQADVTGGEIYAINEQGSVKNLIAPQSSVGYFCQTNNNTYFKIELECAIAEGDRMTAKGYGGIKDGDPNNKGIWVSTATSRPSTAPAADGTSATASLINPILDYTVTSTDEYVGKKTIYVYRAAGASTYFDEFTITRPYTISFSSAKGTAPSATTGFEVALAQITGVEGWIHTGWTADQAVTVGGNSKTAGTALAVDATALLGANTTFTAVWEQGYAITTASPANGTVEADKAAATAGTTVTLTATPSSGYQFGAWDVYKTGDATTKVSVTDNTFTMPEYAVTVSATFAAIPTIDDLVVIDADYTFTPTTTIEAGTITADNRFFAAGSDACDMSGGKMRIKVNRALAFKVAANAKVRVTFTTNGNLEMQLGSERTGDNNTIYGHSKSSPFTSEIITTGGVVYLTATEQLYMSQLEILYPHTVTYALGDGTGTLPTESAHYNGEQFNVHDGETDITAPENKEFSVWSDGTSTYAGGAQYTMGSSNVTLTAQWVTPLPLPTITFNNGSYTIAGDALDLSSLFTSNSDGAVAYTVKDANGTGATIDGTSFTATTEGSAVVTASQAATASYKAKSVDATITVSAPTEPEGTKMVVDNALTGNFRTSQSLSNGSYTVGGITYTKYLAFGSTASSWSAVAGSSNKYMAYTVASTNTKFYFYVHNNASSAYHIEIYKITEGSATPVKEEIEVAASADVVKEYTLATTKNTEVYIAVDNNNIRFCQVIAQETGTAHKTAPAVGYEMNLNKGRLSATSGAATTLEGLTFYMNSNYTLTSSTEAVIKTKGTQYVSFTIPAGQTRQLQLTTSSTSKYTVSKTLGDDENQITPTANEAENFNLEAGTWYINPQGSNVNITNIAFAAAPAQKTVTFKDGLTTLDTKYVWSGDAVAALSPAPTKSGYRFVKWQLGGVDYNFSTPVTDDIVLDAVWQQTCTVTFNSDGGSDVAAAVVDHNTAVAKPADPTKAGNDFAGWTLNSAAYDFSTPVTANITLLATWTPLDNDASISALTYDGNDIDISSGTDFVYVLPYKAVYDAEKLVVTKSAESASVGEITYAAGVASFTVTAGDHTTTQTYTVTFSNGPKDMLCLILLNTPNGNGYAQTVPAANVTGYIGGSAEQKLENGDTKLGSKGHYIGITLAEGTFQAGDVARLEAEGNSLGDFVRIFKSNLASEANELVKGSVAMDYGMNEVTLPANTQTSLWLRRGTDDENYNKGWNPWVKSFGVYRAYPVPVVKTISFNGAEGTIVGTAISATIPYTTNLATLEPEVSFMSNDPTQTSGEVTSNEGAWVEGENTYVVTDKDNDVNTYTITLTRAEVSHDASLTTLAVEGYSIDFASATLNYNVELPYSSVIGDLPAVTYTTAAGATAVKTDAAELPGNTVIEVTAEDGETVQEYSIRFTVSRIPSIVIYDGTTEMEFAAESSSQLVTWTSVDVLTTIQNSGATINDKEYAHNVKVFGGATSASRTMDIVIPENYMAKFYLAACSNSDTEVDIYITKDAVGAKADAAVSVTGDRTHPTWSESDYVMPGHYFLNATNSTRLYELSVTLYPIDHSRDVTPKTYGTICLPNGGIMVGATIFEVAYMTYENAQPYKVFFDEVIDGVMEAGMPYIYLPKEGVSSIAVTYTDEANASAGHHNGLYGTLELMNGTQLLGKYIFYNNSIFASENPQNWLNANRAYIVLDEVDGHETAPAPGRRRVSMGVNGTNGATGLENVQTFEGKAQKVLIDGKIYILRGEKIYDATGRLVK